MFTILGMLIGTLIGFPHPFLYLGYNNNNN